MLQGMRRSSFIKCDQRFTLQYYDVLSYINQYDSIRKLSSHYIRHDMNFTPTRAELNKTHPHMHTRSLKLLANIGKANMRATPRHLIVASCHSSCVESTRVAGAKRLD